MRIFVFKTIISTMLMMFLNNQLSIYAQSTNALVQSEQLETAKQRSQQQQEQIEAPFVSLGREQKKTTKEIQLPEEKISFKINKIVIESSNPSFNLHWLYKLVAPYENKKIGVQGINLINKLLTDNVIEKGYVTTKVIVPEQDLTTGTLRFVVMTGAISNIRFKEENTFGTWKNAFPTYPGKILNIRDLEQGLEQMKRVPNQDVQMQLLPGKNPGESEVVIAVERTKPWQIGFSLDDAGLKSTGKIQASGNIALYNPTGLNDILSYSYGKNAEGNSTSRASKNYSLSYSIPLGNYTFAISQYKNNYHQTVPSFIPFKSSSETETLEFHVQKLIYRDATRKTQASLKLMKKNRHSFIDETELQVQRQKTTAYQFGINHREYIGKSMLNASFYIQKGMPWLGAKPGYGDDMPDMGTTRYSLFGCNANFMLPINIGKLEATYTFTFNGQYTNHTLYAADQFSIGGRYTVRGFSGEYTLSAENGYFIRNEIIIPIKKANMQVYIGADIGRVWGPSDKYLLGKNLAGGAIGIRGNVFNHLQYEAFVGTPIYKPKGFKAEKTVFGFQLYMYF